MDLVCPRLHTYLTSKVGVFSEPPEWRELNGYLNNLAATTAQDIEEKTYVPLNAKDLINSEQIARSRRQGFLTPIQQLIREVVGGSDGGDTQSAQIVAASRKSKTVRNIVFRLRTAKEPLVLLGDPGSGKSLTLKQTSMLIAEHQSKRVFPDLCIYVRLGEFHQSNPDEKSVLDYVKRNVDSAIFPYIDQLDAAGRLVILFDGMDEMSRYKYTEHTRALSVFAASRKHRTKTLFSCRVTDFTPEFRHSRLVLLPFDVPQILRYVRRQIPHFPVKIAGKLWHAKQLARRLGAGDLPMQATNPFVLWLFCFYLLEHEEWPESRVELLRFYNEINYRRKESEAKRSGHEELPDLESAFLTWGKIAFAVTNRNKGTAIRLDELEALLDDQDLKNLEAGKYCGVFQESMDLEEVLIRFEHHRFQEFFTAFYISEKQIQLNWLDKLDAPRWQETMVNLVLMGWGTEAVEVLNRAISETIRKLGVSSLPGTSDDKLDEVDDESLIDKLGMRVDEDDLELEDFETEQSELAAKVLLRSLPPEERTLLSDRVELASRLLKQSVARTDAIRSLSSTFNASVYHLARYGNPIEQVRMLVASQNVPEVDTFRVAQEPIAGKVNWARDQALIATSGATGTSSRALPLEMLVNFARGRFLIRLPSYMKIASALKQSRFWTVLFFGILIMIMQIGMMCGLIFASKSLFVSFLNTYSDKEEALLDSYAVSHCLLGKETKIDEIKNDSDTDQQDSDSQETTSPESQEGTEEVSEEERRDSALRSARVLQAKIQASKLVGSSGFDLALSAVLLCSVFLSLRTAPEYLSHVLVIAGIGFFVSPFVGYLLWSEQLGYAFGVPLIAFFVVGWFPVILYAAFVLVVHGTSIFFFRHTVRYWASDTPKVPFLLRSMILSTQLKPIAVFGWKHILMVFAISLFAVVYGFLRPGNWLAVLSRFGIFPFLDPLSNTLFSLFLYIFLIGLLVVFARSFNSDEDRLESLASYAAGWGGFILVVAAIQFLIRWVLKWMVDKGGYLAPLLLVLLVFVLLVWFCNLCWKLYGKQWIIFARAWVGGPARITITPDTWLNHIEEKSPVEQAWLLRQSTPKMLGITTKEFLELMLEVEDDVIEEPALTSYWTKRNEVEQILRQHRTGGETN